MYLRSQLILPRSIYDSPLKVRTSLLDCFNNMQLTLRLLNAHNCRCQKQMCCHICWRDGMVNEKHYVWWRRGGRPWCLTLMHSVAGNGNHASDLLYERLLFLKTNTHFSCSSKRCTQLTHRNNHNHQWMSSKPPNWWHYFMLDVRFPGYPSCIPAVPHRVWNALSLNKWLWRRCRAFCEILPITQHCATPKPPIEWDVHGLALTCVSRLNRITRPCGFSEFSTITRYIYVGYAPTCTHMKWCLFNLAVYSLMAIQSRMAVKLVVIGVFVLYK